MTCKVNDLVYFDGGVKKGVGKIVSITDGHILVNSTQIKNGHDGSTFFPKQDNENNWVFFKEHLKPFTKKVGQKYKVIRNDENPLAVGSIITLSEIAGDSSAMSRYRVYKLDWDVLEVMYDLDHPHCEVEFYEDAEEVEDVVEEEITKEKSMFVKSDLEVGYVVKTKSGKFAQVVFLKGPGLSILYENRDGLPLRGYSDDLSFNGKVHDIEEVYGHSAAWEDLGRFDAGDRELLWKRKEVIEMTLAELQEHFGYEIKVVD